MWTTLRRRAVAGLLVVAAAFSARGDVEETERRLKSAGVDDALRVRIHEAIARGAKYLIARQDRDGAIRDPGVNWSKNVAEAGFTALSCLALAHVGSAEADDAARRGIRFLCPDGKDLR